MTAPLRVASAARSAAGSTAVAEPQGPIDALTLRPGWFHLARPGVADRLIHPLLDDVAPARSAGLDLDCGLYLPVPPWEMAVHRVRVGDRTQVGLILEVAVADYLAGRIRPHEQTRPHAVDALAGHLADTQVDVAPVTLAHRPDEMVSLAFAEAMAAPPALAAAGDDGAEHHVWLVDADTFAPALDRLARSGSLYVVDGHHRCAAGALLADGNGGATRGEDVADHLFALVVAQDRLEVASYHLIVREVAGPPVEVVRAVERRLGVASTTVGAAEVARSRPGVIGMWCGGRWSRFDLGAGHPDGDVARVHEQVLAPVFGIAEPGADRRLVHVAGTVAPRDLEDQCPEGAVAFVVHPTPSATLFSMADDGRCAPPKSSLFHPKVPAGLFLRRRAKWSA